MSFSVGIVGLPNAGKSTLFKALTKKEVAIAAHPFTTIQPNVGIVVVPDERLKKIAQVVQPEKTTETFIEFIDIAGLVRGAHKGEGLGNQFLSHIRNCDATVEVVRVFENPNIEHVDGNINPERDIETIKIELLMKDSETMEKLFSKLEKEAKSKDPNIRAKLGAGHSKKALKKLELFKRVKELISQGKLISEINLTNEEKIGIKEYQLLTEKPILYLLNTNKKGAHLDSVKYLAMNLKDEEEISELSESEIKELGIKSKLDQLIIACYNILDLITFFTVAGGKEARAWTLKKGSDAFTAAGKVHSDFKEKFIRAEVIPWQKLIAASDKLSEASLAPSGREAWKKAKEAGQIKTVGKEYVVQDGDVIEFKI